MKERSNRVAQAPAAATTGPAGKSAESRRGTALPSVVRDLAALIARALARQWLELTDAERCAVADHEDPAQDADSSSRSPVS